MYSIRQYQAYSFHCWFSNNFVLAFGRKRAFSNSFVTEVGIFFSILLFQLSIFYSFVPEALWCCFFSHHLEWCSFRAYPSNRSVVSSLQVLFIWSSHASLFNRSDVRICSSSFLVYLVSTRVVSIPSCPLCSSFNSFATSKVHMVFIVSILYRSALNCAQLCYVLSFNFSTSQGSLVSLIGRRSNLVLPLLFLFRFLSGAILDLRTRSSCSGGVL